MSQKFDVSRLRIRGTKTLSTIALILLLTVTAIMASMQTAYAANLLDTYAFCTAEPNPVGLGQTVTIVMWLDKPPPLDAHGFAIPYEGYQVTITKPDGNTQAMGPYTSDPIASYYITFVPTTTGTYYVQFSFPGQHITGVSLFGVPNDFEYKASTSSKVALTVQQSPTPAYPSNPLPTSFWKRPINGENYGWNTISGNWLGVPLTTFGNGYDASGAFNPYSTAPNTAHIVWTKPMMPGGIVGGNWNNIGYSTGLSYEPGWGDNMAGPIILNGVIYYNTPVPPRYGFYAVDLRTGQTLWYQNTTSAYTTSLDQQLLKYNAITCGQLYNYDSPNQHGMFAYLWGIGSSQWQMYDAYTGNMILSLVNPAFGTAGLFGAEITYSQTGDMLAYLLGNNWIALWNSTKAIPLGATSGTGVWNWRPDNQRVLDWRNGIQWNVTVPDVPGQGIVEMSSDVILATQSYTTATPPVQMCIGYSATTGQRLWTMNITAYQDIAVIAGFGPIVDGIFTYFDQATLQTYGYDAHTGTQLWVSEPKTEAWGMYSTSYRGAGPPNPQVAYGKVFSTGYDGNVYAYDLKTGKTLWKFTTGSSGYETPYGDYPLYGGVTIADGKIYAPTGDHSPSEPLWRGGRLYCLDANSGKELWSISGWMPGSAIADGYLAVLNNYDGQIYCLGKGQTAVTVSATPKVSAAGSTVMIEGTVTDQSPGETCLGIPAKGTPAISDADMTQWMEYLYEQQPMPDHAAGVQVTLTAIDSNHNTSNIGTTTSDNAGLFHIAWTPPATGEYTIIASFGGSNSYFASSAETGLAVAASTSSSTSSSAPLDLYIIVATIVIIIAIAIAVVVLSRRK